MCRSRYDAPTVTNAYRNGRQMIMQLQAGGTALAIYSLSG